MKFLRARFSKLQSVWANMKDRCYNENNHAFERYGARGITVCPEWYYSFSAFYEWALKAGYQAGLILDRADNDKEYSPANCRWVTASESVNNRRMTKRLTIEDETKSVGEWARDDRCSVDFRRIHIRLARGWSARDAVFRPKRNS